MKTKRKPHKLLSLLLCCVMLVGMMPMATGTAFATNPAINSVLIDGGKCFYTGKQYYKNGDESYSFTGSESDYNAHYDPATGVLTLNGYNGGGYRDWRSYSSGHYN